MHSNTGNGCHPCNESDYLVCGLEKSFMNVGGVYLANNVKVDLVKLKQVYIYD